MPSDRTRSSNDYQQGYRGIVAQQGRVILDRDINALQTLLDGELRRETLDIVGPCGTPDNGFAISLPVLASLPPPDPFDFRISPGTMYVGGLRAVFAPRPANALPISYDHQPDWLSPTPLDPDPSLIEFVYLEVAQQEVSAVEDDDLRDVALGGPDTTQRIRLMQRVKRIGVADGTCSAALADAAASWAATGFALDQATLRLSPQVRLKVGFSDVQVASSPCEPSSTGGYLGADNQLIRVMITGPGTLVWSFDDASFLYAVAAQPDGKTLRLAQTPVDAYHRPARNQAVEVLRGAAILPDGAVIAEATGRVTILATPYDGDAVVITDPLTAAEARDPNLFLRIWQDTATFLPGQPVTLGATGLTVTLQLPPGAAAGAALSVGAYWLIAVRPSTPQQVYPRRLLEGFQPADGPARWICPLAVIDWTASLGPNITNCRPVFDNLVELSRRRSGGCCTITLHPADLAQADPMQVIDGLIGRAGVAASAVTICLSPGQYRLAKPFRLTARHRGLTIEACGGPAILVAANETDPDFLDGLIVLAQTALITLRGLELLPPAVPFADAVLKRNGLNAQTLANLVRGLGNLVGMVGVRVLQSAAVTITDCLFAFRDSEAAEPFAVGVFPSGACPNLTVRNCIFAGSTPTVIPSREIRLAAGTTSLRETLLTTTLARPVSAAAAAAAEPSVAAAAPAAAFSSTLAAAAATEATAAVFASMARSAIGQKLAAQFGVAWVTALTFVDGQGGPNDEQVVLAARIGDFAITGCTFTRLTGAVLTLGDTGVARLQANTLADSGGGFWLDATGLGSSPSVALFNRNLQTFLALLPNTGSARVAAILSLLYPLPTAAPAVSTDGNPPPVQLVLADNILSALPSDGSQSGPGLLVLTSSGESRNDPQAVVTVTGNQVTNRAAQSTNATGVFVGPRGGLMINGNLFANAQPPTQVAGAGPIPPSCLLIEVSVITAGPPPPSSLAVTGNTVRGDHNLAQNLRAGFAAPLDNWAFANAVLT